MHVSLPKQPINQIKPVQQRRQQLTLLTYTVLKWVKVQCTLWGVSFFYVCKCIVCMCMKTECSVKKWPFQLCHKGDTVGSPDLNLTSNIHIRVLQHCATPSMAISVLEFQAFFSLFYFLFPFCLHPTVLTCPTMWRTTLPKSDSVPSCNKTLCLLLKWFRWFIICGTLDQI